LSSMLRPGTAAQNQHKQLPPNDTRVKECLLQGLTKTERLFTISSHLQHHV